MIDAIERSTVSHGATSASSETTLRSAVDALSLAVAVRYADETAEDYRDLCARYDMRQARDAAVSNVFEIAGKAPDENVIEVRNKDYHVLL